MKKELQNHLDSIKKFNSDKVDKLDDFKIKYLGRKGIVNDLISNFKGSVSNLLKFLDLSWSDRVSEFYKTSQKRGMITTPSYNQVNQPIYTKSIGRWKNYEKELNYLINIRNGNVFFTADTSISQTAPTTSNTERMRDSHMRFNYFYLGDSLGDVV